MTTVGSAAYGTAGHPSEWMAESPTTSQHHRHCQQYQIHIPLRSCRIWDCEHESKRATLVWQVFRHSLTVALVCESSPLIRVRHRCLTFLRLRVVCRVLLVNVVLDEKALLYTHWEKGRRPGGLVTSSKNSALWLPEPVSGPLDTVAFSRRSLAGYWLYWASNGHEASLFR